MFTGLIEELGVIEGIERYSQGARFQVRASLVLQEIKKGDSICLNGCCLTVTDYDTHHWKCDIVQETLERTTFQSLKMNDPVNLERAIRYHDRLGGHLVQGHVDGVGKILSKKQLDDLSWWVTIETPSSLLRYLVFKGCVAVDGVSLTIGQLDEKSFSFAMIPHTSNLTTLGLKTVQEEVNLEVDLIAKYVERLTAPFPKKENKIYDSISC